VQVYQENILQVEKLCDLEGVSDVDTIISSLPWAVTSAAEQDQYFDAMFAVLKPGGQFTTFAYIPGLLLPAGQRFQRQLTQRFSTVRRSRMVWRNVPPAYVYHCCR
jgi:phospholipid N-methyltransferase